MTVAALVHVSCDRCPWQITDDQAAALDARSEHAYAHEQAGKPTTFTETTEEPAVLSDDTHTHTHTHTQEPAQPVTAIAEPEVVVATEGKTVTQIAEEEAAFYAAQPITVRCADCLWEHTALSSTARLEWAKHRRDQHGDDQIVAVVARSLNGDTNRGRSGAQAGKPRASIQVGTKTLKENVAGARAAGADGSRVYSDPPAESDGDTNEEEHVSEPANPGRPAWTREKAIERIQAFAEANGRPPKQPELRAPLPSCATLIKLFGSQSAAIEAAGLTAPRSGQGRSGTGATREAVIAAIQRYAAEHGAPPTTNDQAWHDGPYPSIATVKRLFGNLGTAVREAGFEHTGRGRRGFTRTGPATAKAPAAASETVPKPNRPAGRASEPRSLAAIEADLQEQEALVADHERAIETAKLQIQIVDAKIDELLDEARARIESVTRRPLGQAAR